MEVWVFPFVEESEVNLKNEDHERILPSGRFAAAAATVTIGKGPSHCPSRYATAVGVAVNVGDDVGVAVIVGLVVRRELGTSDGKELTLGEADGVSLGRPLGNSEGIELGRPDGFELGEELTVG